MTPSKSRTGRPWTRFKARIIRRDAGICHLCGKPGADTADHLVPVAFGGAIYDEANTKAAHIVCNRIRGTRPIAIVQAELAAADPDNQPDGWTW